MAIKDDISTTNGLIKTTLDSMKGYREASEDSTTVNAAFFCEKADQRRAVATRLQSHVASLGGDPQDDSSASAAAHRGFMNLKQAIMGTEEKAVVEEVERGEDFIKAKYEAALKSSDLSPSTRSVIEEAYISIKAGHDKISAMKHALR